MAILLITMILIDLSFSSNDFVHQYFPNFAAEILGIILVIAFVDQLLKDERKRESERFQQHQRIENAGLNIRSIPDENKNLLRAEFEKLWHIGGLGEEEFRRASMDELFWISIFIDDQMNKAELLAEAVRNQFLELVGPEDIPFDEKWKEELILKGIEVLENIGCIAKVIFNLDIFNQILKSIQSFLDIARAYGKNEIAKKCFKTLDEVEKCTHGYKGVMTDKDWKEYKSFTSKHISELKNKYSNYQ